MTLLPPVETPGFLMRVVYRVARRRYGKVLMPLRVIYSRAPVLLAVGLLIEWIRDHATVLDPGLRSLVTVYVSTRRSCDFCADLGLALAVRKGMGPERFDQLPAWRGSTAFSPASVPRSRGSMTLSRTEESARRPWPPRESCFPSASWWS